MTDVSLDSKDLREIKDSSSFKELFISGPHASGQNVSLFTACSVTNTKYMDTG